MPQVITTTLQTTYSADGVAMPVWPKDPNDVVDYTLDWTDQLVTGDTIIAVTYVIAPANELSVLSADFTNTGTTLIDNVELTNRLLTTCWLQAGVLAETYSVTARITTDSGREQERTFEIICGQN